jgi:hypothetical protein
VAQVMMADDIAPQVVTKADLDAGLMRLDHKIDSKVDKLAVSTKAEFVAVQGQITLLHWMCGFTLALCLAMLWMLVRIATGK